MRSIAAASTAPTAHAAARSRMRSASTSRRSGSSCLLSLRPRMGRSGERITAAANTAPNSDPRPTSSTPAMARKPRARNARSIVASQRSLGPALFVAFADATWASPASRPLLALPQPRGFALEVAQIIQFGASHPARTHHVDMIDHPRVQRKNALDPLSKAHLADRNAFAHARILARNHRALERLQPLLVAFLDFDVNANRVAGPERRYLGAVILLNELGQQRMIHNRYPFNFFYRT